MVKPQRTCWTKSAGELSWALNLDREPSSPMGADHTAGNGIFMKTDHLDPKGKAKFGMT